MAAVAGLGATAWLSVSYVPKPSSDPPSTTTPTSLRAPAHSTTTVPATTTTTQPPPPMEPGGGRQLFPSHRVVAFYGAAGDPELGVLGDDPPGQLWPKLVAQASHYAAPGVVVVPSYELIAYVATAAPGNNDGYAARISDATIQAYLKVVQAHHGMLILDIQPGRTSFLDDAKTLVPYLSQPDVALALDPEWELQPDEVPLRQIGHTTAGEINAVSTWLSQLVTANRLPQKLLLIHQFTAAMIQDKPAVTPKSDLAITFNMDGFGGQANKASKYAFLASDPRFPLGFKLFYQRDTAIYDPAGVLALKPPPSVVEYE